MQSILPASTSTSRLPQPGRFSKVEPEKPSSEYSATMLRPPFASAKSRIMACWLSTEPLVP